MVRIHLVRHGKAAASFSENLDPGLDETGKQQALLVSMQLSQFGLLPLCSSPLKRAVETAEPLRLQTQQTVRIDDRFAEIPSSGKSLQERGLWIRSLSESRWSEQETSLKAWRQHLIDALLAIQTDTIIFSHFIAINVAVGAAQCSDDILVFQPDNASVTTLDTDGKKLSLITRGKQASTKIL
ncbi:MAG: histidine phosphatase family protein [Spongiibacteraceae bacterium]|nr:histidine phosphatase family protein [Spongiibacteraceae bacterium]